MPDDTGNGLAMRGALFLRALTRRWNVCLLVVPVAGSLPTSRVWPAVTDACVDVVVVPPEEDPLFRFILSLSDPTHRLAALASYPLPTLARFSRPPAVEAALDALGTRRFDGVHVFRIYMAPFAEPFLGTARACLDLDDAGARTAASLARLAHRQGHSAEGALYDAEASKLAVFEALWARRFQTISFAAPEDVEEAASTLPEVSAVCVPNAVTLPARPSPAPVEGPLTLLFVGSMGYAPNRDAAMFLATEILPALQQRTTARVRLILAGSSPDADVQALARSPDVEVTGRVDDLGPLYGASHAVVAPLRAGGGTRIKILEAFAYNRPVVATRLGAEGIMARDGEHLLLADSTEELVDACLRLIEAPALRSALAHRARSLVARSYARDRIVKRIDRLLPAP